MQSPVEPSKMILTVIDANNGIPKDHEREPGVLYDEITIWGGRILNCGESQVSYVVYCSRNSLQKFTYFPAYTKGGAMVRPLYCEGDRSGKCDFSNLESLSMPLQVIEFTQSLHKCGWVTPRLKTLTLLDQNSDHNAGGPEILALAQNIVSENPQLERISISVADFSSPASERRVVSLLTPVNLSRDKVTLLLLALKKEDPTTCLLARFPSDLIIYIYSMLTRRYKIVLEEESS